MPLDNSAIVREPIVLVLARPQFVEPPHLSIRSVGEATEGERLAEFAGRLQHMSHANPAERSTREYLEQATARGAGDLLEHVCYTLLFEGVSQSLTHALQRVSDGCVCTEVSPRSVTEHDARFVLPPAIAGDDALEQLWSAQVANALAQYRALVDALMTRFAWVDDKVRRRHLARDGARAVLPQSASSRMVITGSVQAWRSLLLKCAGDDTELELRRLSVAMLRVLQQEAPALFGDATVYAATDRHDAVRMGQGKAE